MVKVHYLQLDVPNHPVDVKRRLAQRFGVIFAPTTPDYVTVAFHELAEGGVWRCGDGEPEPAAMLTCDMRRGRPPEQRAALAQALIDACVDTLGLQSDRVGVEFTQHTGDELFRVGRGMAPDWTPAEAKSLA